MATKNSLQMQAKTLFQKLERAEMLVNSLTGENKRWRETEQELMEKYDLLVGDCLLATSFTCYLGPFTAIFRDDLMKFWFKEIEGRSIPISVDFDALLFLADSAIILEWNIQGLPVDKFSSENGVLVENATKWPIFIDPETQAYNWLRNKEKSLKITEFSSPELSKILEVAIFSGTSVLIQNIGEDFPTILMPILNKLIVRQGGTEMIEFNDKLIDYNQSFRLFFSSRIGNPHFLPEISTKTKIINFSVKEEGLEEQLLGILIGKEKPSLEEQKINLVVNISKHKRTLKDLEVEILRYLFYR
jgi:dynein heavy chain